MDELGNEEETNQKMDVITTQISEWAKRDGKKILTENPENEGEIMNFDFEKIERQMEKQQKTSKYGGSIVNFIDSKYELKVISVEDGTLKELIEEWKSHIEKQAILTFPFGRTWDVRKLADGSMFFGINKRQNQSFEAITAAHIYDEGITSCILRSFLKIRDELNNNIPVKELRGYLLTVDIDNKIKFEQLDAKALAEACNVDSSTGKPLKPERSVIYCGPNNEKLI
ncbi:MAG: hypothetical protein M1465_00900 [Candidatus Marsarchaeota archaeon]|nr:hypothetical protein [Candidatus Marsarchaeota archaeon]